VFKESPFFDDVHPELRLELFIIVFEYFMSTTISVWKYFKQYEIGESNIGKSHPIITTKNA